MSTSDYSEDSIPLALPSPGDTSTPARPLSESLMDVEGLTIVEAASAYGVSVSNIRRLIKPGKEGEPPKVAAALVPSPKGATYRILPGEMERLGYKVKTTQAGAILTAATAAAESETLTKKVQDLESRLQVSEILLASKSKELELVTAHLDDLRDALAKMPKAIEAESTRPPKWYRRKK